MSEDGWDQNETIEGLLAAYLRIEEEIAANPVRKEIKEPENDSYRKHKGIQIHSEVDDMVYYLPNLSDDEDECKTIYFKPPLQVQRNQNVKNILKNFVHHRKYKLKKLAVLGCGESSIEKFLCHEFGNIVDIEEGCLAKGIRLLRQELIHHKNIILNNDLLPVLHEHYLGNILKYDERLFNTDCVCSTEVIEHLPIEDAEKFVRLVLDQIRPKLFILSTPNHEYNKAFGMDVGQFRHDDHKFEFNRAEFSDWLAKILETSGQEYHCDVHYVGNLRGYENLQGATQFATFYRGKEEEKEPFSNERSYEKVADSVACYGLHTILVKRGKMALRKYLENNKLDKDTLIKTEYANFWEVPLNKIIELMHVPSIVLSKVVREKFLDMLKATSRGRIFMKHGGDHASDSEHFIIIPEDCSIEHLIGILNN